MQQIFTERTCAHDMFGVHPAFYNPVQIFPWISLIINNVNKMRLLLNF